uniref:Retrotransposon protein n=1 Tax=Solanum tuberosum TaxID=4113 RepID=M1BNP4_SOLTU
MEDHRVLKDFVDDSIREIKDSICKDLTKFRSMLLEVLGGKATSFEPQNTVTNAKLWQFRGKNPEAWIVQAKNYFDFHKIEEDQKLNVASFYLDGEALKCYQWLFRNNQLIDWPHFADKVRIRFKQKGFESTGGRFANFEHVTYVTEYQNCCEDSPSESSLLFPSHTYVHPQWRNITNSFLSQYKGEQSECKSNTNAHKVFDESSDRHKDANSLCTSSKPIEFFITPNDLVSFVSKIENSCGDDVENEDKNDEEEIVTIRNKPIEFVIANANKPSFWIDSIVSTTCDLSMFDKCKALDDRWNQLFAYPVRLAQRWKEMPSISYTFNYAKLMSKVTNDGRNWNYVGCSIILALDMRPELVECEGYDLKCLGS